MPNDNLDEILKENQLRNARLQQAYDPIAGVGCCGSRVQCGDELLPSALIGDHPEYASLTELERRRLRVIYDFEYWCATCATIVDKLSSVPIHFRLNGPQRKVLAIMENQREQGQPVRIILLKARQWGGSTLVQMYMAWMQLVRHTGWNSLICGHIRQTSRAIKAMYTRLLRHYPKDLLPDGMPAMQFRNFEGSRDVQVITGRDCLVVMGSAKSEDAVRGYNLAMAHLTEVAFWPSTPAFNPEDVMRSVGGTVTRMPDSVVALESTANGVGHYFHTEWLRACAGQSDKVPVFVAWHEIEIYRTPVRDAARLWQDLDDYERQLWDDGLTLEMIQWYHDKRNEYPNHVSMMAEFPSNDVEAFACNARSVFDLHHIDLMRKDCRPPVEKGEVQADHKSLHNVHFNHDGNGRLKVWEKPCLGARRTDYLVTVDVGGRSDKADYSVILVMRVSNYPRERPEVVAQWRGHIDHDLLAWKAAQIAHYYGGAKLVVESNTLETEATDADAGEFILTEIGRHYPNLYCRKNNKPGFHTNASTKRRAIYGLIAAVRDRTYVEHDIDAIDELVTYETTPQGGFQAMKGHHDDMLMTRAIALSVLYEITAPVQPISERDLPSLIGPKL